MRWGAISRCMAETLCCRLDPSQVVHCLAWHQRLHQVIRADVHDEVPTVDASWVVHLHRIRLGCPA